jgi:hypothetical protein
MRLSAWRPSRRRSPKLRFGYQTTLSEMSVCGPSGQPRVVDRAADREVVQVLEFVPAQTEQVVGRVVEVAADAGAADAGRLRR